MKKLTALFLIVTAMMSCNSKKEQESTPVETTQVKERIISLNGAITETLVALGEKENIIAVDVTSTYPEDIKTTAQDLGHTSKISIESIMALKPTVIYATEKDLNDDFKSQLEKTKIRLEVIKQEFTLEGTKTLIKTVAQSLNNENYQSLLDKIDQDLQGLPSFENKPKVLFIYARGAATLLVAGDKTPVNNIVDLAGGQNAVTEFEDFKPLTPESLLNSNPDYILMFTTGLQSMGGIDGVLKIDGINKTNAGKNKKVIAMDGLLLSGFGPRVGQAAKELNQLLSE
ncbi:ABC transporter substrate-binding protein [Myroides odoratimimus]|uniref:heme/hemin ABC transporter substrate-binding protein n=1 Tax=Myroides odoratimimus TaxID=76832 RepID=UPI00103B19B2|nr:ABC transporter substrate-binding protein [Myroides odoratimimus]MDM1494510.1 ABC transporter substrate-binding protein [Myroides odoratimimus]MDM1527950.1 ABC transporter substrate-binding protein [Myroides odoratimimus]QBK75792.1 hemin ABC transporter substrate-binding protein [Myroides odoratimimus]WHT74504.1 ABC transporter substrate-binding protein [Myroides odoratimimus]WHU39086.1 ABC transporter substrate-binding protein [Myroides odoratimimus]